MFAGTVGARTSLDSLHWVQDPISTLFDQEFNTVVRMRQTDLKILASTFVGEGCLFTLIHVIGTVKNIRADPTMTIIHELSSIFTSPSSRGMTAAAA